MKAFISTSINIFPDIGLKIINAGFKGDLFKAKDLQDKLSRAVVAISKHGS